MSSFIGATISVAADTPAAEDQSGYEALSFTEIGKIVSISDLGDSHEDISSAILKTGRMEHANGVADGGELNVVHEYSSGDSGITIIEAGNGTNTNHSFQIVDPDGDEVFFQGIIANLKERERTASNKKGGSFDVRINTGLTRVRA